MPKTFKSKPESGYKWYVVYTQPRNEKKCAVYLTEQNIQFYLPLVKTIRQWSDRKKKVEIPLFPSYMFVFISQKEYYDVLNVPGISRYLFFEGKPATIRQKDIDKIKMLLGADIDIDVTTEKFSQGDEVEITYGPMRGIRGEMVSYKNERKVAIKIQQIDFSLLIHVPVNQLKLIGSR